MFGYQDEAVLHRPDVSLFIYGFVQMRDPPLLCAVDLPAFDISRVYTTTPLTDAHHGGHFCEQELESLA